jgi:AraC family transcriptional regulator
MSNTLDDREDTGPSLSDRWTATPADGSMPEQIAVAAGIKPMYVLPSAWGARLSAARWNFLGRTILKSNSLHELVLGCRAAGTATIVRSVSEGSLRRRPVLGSVSLMNPEQNAEWLIDGNCEVVHLYIPRTALAEFSRKAFGSDLSHCLREFVGVRDPWLGAYFQMLNSEIAYATADPDGTDPMFLAESESMLLRHLLEWHSDADRSDLKALERGRRIPPLRSAILQRVKEYVDVHLAEDIHLVHLAAVACMSDDHFLRSFRAACGTTPYQYVIEKRVERACRLLSDTRIPISQIARDCGFKNAPQFSLRFRAATGVSPSRYRGSARP